MKNILFISIITLISVSFNACGSSSSSSGSGDTDTDTALETAIKNGVNPLPSTISVDGSDLENNDASTSSLASLYIVGSDYENTNVKAWDGTLNYLKTPNMFLDIMEKTQAIKHIDKGQYVAYIKEEFIAEGKEVAALKYVIDVTTNDDGYIIVKIYRYGALAYKNNTALKAINANEVSATIYTTIKSATSTDKPYGDFELAYYWNDKITDTNTSDTKLEYNNLSTHYFALVVGNNDEGRAEVKFQQTSNKSSYKTLFTIDTNGENVKFYQTYQDNELNSTLMISSKNNYLLLQESEVYPNSENNDNDTTYYDKNIKTQEVWDYKVFKKDDESLVTENLNFDTYTHNNLTDRSNSSDYDGNYTYVSYYHYDDSSYLGGLWKENGGNLQLKDGTTLSSNGVEYIVKATEILTKLEDVTNTIEEADKPANLSMVDDSEFEISFNSELLRFPTLSDEYVDTLTVEVGEDLNLTVSP